MKPGKKAQPLPRVFRIKPTKSKYNIYCSKIPYYHKLKFMERLTELMEMLKRHGCRSIHHETFCRMFLPVHFILEKYGTDEDISESVMLRSSVAKYLAKTAGVKEPPLTPTQLNRYTQIIPRFVAAMEDVDDVLWVFYNQHVQYVVAELVLALGQIPVELELKARQFY